MKEYGLRSGLGTDSQQKSIAKCRPQIRNHRPMNLPCLLSAVEREGDDDLRAARRQRGRGAQRRTRGDPHRPRAEVDGPVPVRGQHGGALLRHRLQLRGHGRRG